MKIRYDVYCVKKGWESAEEFPDQLETDEFDESAVHILLKDRHSGKAVGTTRVIYPDPSQSDGNLPSLCLSPEFRDKAADRFNIASTIEVSRFALALAQDKIDNPPPADRRRRDTRSNVSLSATKRPENLQFRERQSADRRTNAVMRGIFPALTLIKGCMTAIAFDGIDTMCMTMTPSLRRMLQRAGFRYHDLGVRIEHRGTRIPMFRDIPALLAELHDVNPDIWRFVTEDGETWPLDRTALKREQMKLAI